MWGEKSSYEVLNTDRASARGSESRRCYPSLNFDLIRVASSVAVVWLHTSALLVVVDPSVDSVTWWIGNVADAFSRWAVPTFVMLGGALLIPKATEIEPTQFIVRRVPRLLLITAFWTAIYEFAVAWNFEPVHLVKHVALGQPFYHLWYLYMLLGLLVFTPAIATFVQAMPTRTLVAYVVLCFGIASAESLASGGVVGGKLFVSKFIPFISFFVTGHLLVSYSVSLRKAVLIGTVIASGMAIAVGTAALLPILGERSWDIMYSRFNPLVIVLSLAMFLLLLQAEPPAWIRQASRLTLGIYLLHPIWLLTLSNIGLNGFSFGAWGGIPATTLAVVVCSAASTLLLSKVPGVRNLV